jgi:beta-glucanase (GH16 family)
MVALSLRRYTWRSLYNLREDFERRTRFRIPARRAGIRKAPKNWLLDEEDIVAMKMNRPVVTGALASILVGFSFFCLAGCLREQAPVSAVPEGMQLVWSDEFETAGAPDSSKWDYSTGGNGWGNAEVQNYTNTRENSFVKDGKLTLRAINSGGSWTSARLKTQYKAEWTYGYIEIRAKLPKGVGTWPAIWMLPSFDKYGGWPRSGEIDIMEHVGFDKDMVHTTAHTQAFNHKKGTQKNAHAVVAGATSGFHVYGVEWKQDHLQWFVDGKPFYRFDKPEGATVEEWPFDIPFHLIMNVAIGGGWGGQKGIDKRLKTADMVVDYVRVYQ